MTERQGRMRISGRGLHKPRLRSIFAPDSIRSTDLRSGGRPHIDVFLDKGRQLLQQLRWGFGRCRGIDLTDRLKSAVAEGSLLHHDEENGH
jgi:hypothetical protein